MCFHRVAFQQNVFENLELLHRRTDVVERVSVHRGNIVDAIVGVKTGNNGMHQDVPADPILMNKVTVVE